MHTTGVHSAHMRAYKAAAWHLTSNLYQRDAGGNQHEMHLDVALGVGLEGVDHVRELHAIAHKEHRKVVANHVIIALARVELDRKAAGIANRLRAAALVDDRAEAHRDWRLHTGGAQEVGACQVADVMRHLHCVIL